MTLAQAKQIVRFLLDAEVYFQYEKKLSTYFDLGQKRIACTTDFLSADKVIVQDKAGQVDLTEMDERFYRLKKIEGGEWEKLSPTRVELQKGEYHIYYEIYPTDITDQTPEEYEFEISEFAQTALPYFVAAQITIAEHDLRYHQIYSDEFAAILENAAQARASGNLHVVQFEGWNK